MVIQDRSHCTALGAQPYRCRRVVVITGWLSSHVVRWQRAHTSAGTPWRRHRCEVRVRTGCGGVGAVGMCSMMPCPVSMRLGGVVALCAHGCVRVCVCVCVCVCACR